MMNRRNTSFCSIPYKGSAGPETVTLQNAVDNADYLYAIGVHDYSGVDGLFGTSQAQISVTNGTTTFSETLPISDVSAGR